MTIRGRLATLLAFYAICGIVVGTAQAASNDCNYESYLFTDRLQDRVKACTELLGSDVDPIIKSKILLYRAQLKSSAADATGAMEDVEDAIRSNPRNDRAFVERGMYASRQKDGSKQAIADYNQALAVNPGNTLALSFRSQEEVKTPDYEHATDDLTEVIRLSDSYNYYIARGNVWALRGRYLVVRI